MMTLNRRQFAQGMMISPLGGGTLKRFQSPSHLEPPTLLWEMLELLPAHTADGTPIQLTGGHGEMMFPGTVRSTRGIPPEQVRPIIEADTQHMLDMRPVATDEQLAEFCGVGISLDSIEAIGTFMPCTIYIGDFSVEEVHSAWDSIGYASTEDADIWSWNGLTEQEMDAQASDALLALQQRLALPPRSHGRYRFLTCIDNRYIVESPSGDILRQIRLQYAEQSQPDPPMSGLLTSLGSIPASIGHVARLYQDEHFVTERRADSGSDRLNRLRTRNEEVLASIETELGRMPQVHVAFLGITPGAPWRDPLDGDHLPDITSTSIANIRLGNERDAERFLSIAKARFETLVSTYTETPYRELFSFEGTTSSSTVAIDLGHARTRRYDILQMAYFNDLAFLTWEPDDQYTWRSAR